MTNQDTHEPQAIAQNGNIIITGWDAEYTIEAASAFIGDIAIAIKEACRQLAAIAEACTQGHHERITRADYVEFGQHRIPVTVDPRLPAEAVIVAATCACGHPADYHTSHGCGYALTWCSCTTDVARLATKITGIGES